MSSPRLDVVLRTRVFQIALSAAAVCVAVGLGLLWGTAWAALWQLERAETARLQEVAAFAEEVYYADGTDAVAWEIAWDGRPIWDAAAVYEVLEEGGDILVLRDAGFEPVAGYPGLFADDGLAIVTLDHPEIDIPVRALFVPLRGGESVTVARFLPERADDIREFATTGSLLLLAIALPLSLVTGIWVARSVHRRLAPITATAETVARGRLSERAPASGSGDEFDRLAGGINAMLDQIEGLTRNIEGVTVGVAHDLKTPLANIGGRLELIRRDSANMEAVLGHVDVAEARLAQLLRIFDALLRLGEIEAGKRRAGFEEVDLSNLAARLAEAYAPAFEDADKTLRTEIAPGVRVNGDRELLEQLTSNLLDNALEHARDAAQVHVAVEAGVLRIGDDGPGIPPPLAARIFERFFRGDASRSRPGNGLGLALVKAIADLHGAEVTLLSDQPGAVFSIRFHTES